MFETPEMWEKCNENKELNSWRKHTVKYVEVDHSRFAYPLNVPPDGPIMHVSELASTVL